MTATTLHRDTQRATARDHRLALRAQTAAELMTAQVVSIDQAAPLHQAVATLVDRTRTA